MSESAKIRILIADDHPAMCEGLMMLINRQPDMEVVAEAFDGADAVDRFERYAPDVGVFDLRMPGMDGIQAIAAIRDRFPGARILILSAFDQDERIHQALRAGAQGYLRKDVALDRIVKEIRDVYNGVGSIRETTAMKMREWKTRLGLSPRELEVLGFVVAGKSNKEIALVLNICEGTVKIHLNRMMRKLGARGRVEAIHNALKQGIVDLE